MSRNPRRRFDPFGRRSMALSAALHAALFVLVWVTTLVDDPWEMEFVTYEIELVSPPAAQQVEEVEPEPATEELVVERPEPEPPEPEVEEVVPVEQEEPEPEPEPEREEPVEEEPPEPAEEEVPATTPDPPEEEPADTGEDINVRMEGLQRDYPQYYANIINQINRCFRWREGGRWETVIFFYIDREGNAEGIDWVRRSGNTSFDIEAMGAVECAGRDAGFGPLPDDLPYDRFPIRFRFSPRGQELQTSPWSMWGGSGHPTP